MKKIYCFWCGTEIPEFDLDHCPKIDDKYFCRGKSCFAYNATKGRTAIRKQQLLNFTFKEAE